MAGYFSVERELLNHHLWLCEAFSRGQAWVDIIGLANHKEGYIRIAGEKVLISRGQCGWSELKLAQRWRWSRGKVQRFIRELKDDAMIDVKTSTRTTIITVCNYDKYQFHGNFDGTTDEHQTDIRQDTNKKGKKKDKKIDIAFTPEFENFWDKFPTGRKGDRKATFSAWKTALTKATAKEIMDGLEAYIGSSYVSDGFIKGAAAWLNDCRWTWDYNRRPKVGGKTEKPAISNYRIL